MLLCGNSFKRAAGFSCCGQIAGDTDKAGGVANAQLVFLCGLHFRLIRAESQRGNWDSRSDTNTHACEKKAHSLQNKEQMSNKMNHKTHTPRQGGLTIYHKSASGEVLNSCAVWCKMKKERETDAEKETWSCTPWHKQSLVLDSQTNLPPGFICGVVTTGWRHTSYSSLKP